jgi:hypothetical protein
MEETSNLPPPVVLNGSALPKAAAAVAELESANDDAAPDSGEVAIAKEREEKAQEPVKPEPESAAVKMRTDRPDRPERRTRERKGGRGRSTPPPPATDATAPAEPATAKAPAEATDSPEKVASGLDKLATHPADLDERFFAEGVHSEHEMLAAAVASTRPSASMEEEIDPKILLKLQPDVRARRAKFGSFLRWVFIACGVIIGIGLFIRYRNNQSGQEAAERDMAAYAAAHTYTEPTDKPPPLAAPTQAAQAAAAAPTAATSAEQEAVPPPPAESAAAGNPAAPGAVAEKAPLGPEAKAVAAATPGAAPGAAQADTDTPPAKTAQQEKRAAQALLERGAFGNAAAAGERSVALDPTDGEAWLLLGAAYDSQGRKGDAKRSYNNCLTQAKRGPIGECRAMLQ